MKPHDLAGRLVLVVEDEMMVAMMLEDILAEAGCTLVGPATRIEQALLLIEQGHVEVAVLDVNLNGEESYPVADELRRRGIPFVFATGYGTAGLRADYQEQPTLQKPFLERALTDALTRALDSARG